MDFETDKQRKFFPLQSIISFPFILLYFLLFQVKSFQNFSCIFQSFNNSFKVLYLSLRTYLPSSKSDSPLQQFFISYFMKCIMMIGTIGPIAFVLIFVTSLLNISQFKFLHSRIGNKMYSRMKFCVKL